MGGEPDHPGDISRFLQFDDIHHCSIDSGLNLLWSNPSPPSPVEDQLVGMIRRIIVRTWQEQMIESEDRPATFANFIQLDGEDRRQDTYLLTIQVIAGGDENGDEPIYNAVAQKVAGPIENGANGAAAASGEWTNSKSFRRFLHKLSNPLSIISGFSQYMLEKNPSDGPDREFLEEIFSNARRIRDMIDEVALPAKSGPLPPKEEQGG